MGKANGSPDRDLLAAAIEESPVLIAITSFEGRVEHVNPAGRAFLGLDRSGADSGRDLGALLHPDDRAALAAAIDTLRRGEVWNGELRFVDPGTGAEIPTDTTAFVIHRRGTGEPVAVAWAARDVTQRRRMEEQLRESERRFREALENVRVASVMLDLQGRILFLNDHLLGLVGWRAEELLGRNWFELVVPDASVRRLFEELVPTGRLPAHFENEIFTRSGQRLLMAWHNEYLRDAMGRIVGTTSIGENVTERRQAERALAESERRYRSLVEDMPALVCRFRPDGVLTFVNQHYCDTFGFKGRSEVEGRDFFRFIPEPKREEVRRHYASLAPDRPAVTYEHEVIGPGGELRWQRWTDRALFDDRGSAVEYQSMGEDITERRRTEERLRASLAEKEILLKEIHHRVKNNLQIVSSLLDLQARHVPERRARQMLEESTARVRSMALIHEHLFQAKEVARIDFSRYVRDLVDRLMQTHSGGEGSVAVQVDVPTLPLPLDTAIPCGLIVNELVTNALKHAFPSGRGGSVRVGIEVAAGSRATLRVADDGVGMAAPVDPAAATTLGLSIVATLARQVGGRLEFRGGPGTEVLLEFPVQPGEGG